MDISTNTGETHPMTIHKDWQHRLNGINANRHLPIVANEVAEYDRPTFVSRLGRIAIEAIAVVSFIAMIMTILALLAPSH